MSWRFETSRCGQVVCALIDTWLPFSSPWITNEWLDVCRMWLTAALN